MQITINGQAVDVAEKTLAKILEERGFQAAIVATAVNEEFVPVSRRADQILKTGDRLEIVSPREGG